MRLVDGLRRVVVRADGSRKRVFTLLGRLNRPFGKAGLVDDGLLGEERR